MRLVLGRVPLIVCALFICGCAGKTVTPVAMSQPGDEQLSCEGLNQQIADNEKAAEEFLQKNERAKRENGAKALGAVTGVGVLLLFSADFSNEGQIKARAIVDRNERLTFLAKQKGCMK